MKVKIYTILSLKEVIGQRELEVSLKEGKTVRDLVDWMVETWGEKLSSQLFQPGTTEPLPHVRLMINGRDIRFLKGMETAFRDGDEFLMLPLVAGG